MSWLLPSIIATLSNTTILALVYLYLYLKEKEASLLLFFISWCIYSLRFVAMLLYIYFDRVGLLVINQSCVIISGHLLLVAFNSWLKRIPSPPVLNISTSTALLWVVVVGFLGLPFSLYTIPIFLYVGILYIRAAYILMRSTWSSMAGIRIVSVTLLIWGFHKMDYPFLRPVEWFAPWGYLLGAVAAVVTAIGMILIYFETAKKSLNLLLREKEVLIKEVHHRVKNNLSILHGLVNHSMASTEDPGLKEVLKKLEDKIFAFALIHSILHKSETVEEIDFGDYLRKLLHHLLESYGEKEEILSLAIIPEPLFLEISLAKNLGLIVNELVTNALKHAFSSSNEKHIQIKITEKTKSLYSLSICDSGTGFSQDLGIQNPKMSGIYLVRMLCEEIGGELEVRSEQGTEMIIHFPKKNADG